MTRREAREQAFILIFEKSFNDQSGIDELISLAKEFGVVGEDEFLETLVLKVSDMQTEIDEHISKNAKGWKLNRISKVSLAILRIALAEILYFNDIPSGVSINEAVELAKKYASDEDASFVNGLLGTVARSV